MEDEIKTGGRQREEGEERGEWKDGLSRVICREESSKPILLRAVDPKRLIGNQNSYQLFNRYRANQLQKRRHGRRGDLSGESGDRGDISCMGVRHKGLDFLSFSLSICSETCHVVLLF